MGVHAGLGVESDIIGARLGECGNEALGIGSHEMDVERKRGAGANIMHHFRSERDLRDKMAIHHVEVDPIGPRAVYRRQSGGDIGEVRGQDRGRNKRVIHSAILPPPRELCYREQAPGKAKPRSGANRGAAYHRLTLPATIG